MILVVDDDKNIRLSLKLILERNEYEVALAVQGMRAGAFDLTSTSRGITWHRVIPLIVCYSIS
jgi:DNA-binding response OmpR family regulator